MTQGQIEKYILANPKFKKSSKKLILVQDVFNVTEKEFEEMFIEQASEVVKLLRHAVNAEIKETANLKKRWHKIKKYPFKVPLEATVGGSCENAVKCYAFALSYIELLDEDYVAFVDFVLLSACFDNCKHEKHLSFIPGI